MEREREKKKRRQTFGNFGKRWLQTVHMIATIAPVTIYQISLREDKIRSWLLRFRLMNIKRCQRVKRLTSFSLLLHNGQILQLMHCHLNVLTLAASSGEKLRQDGWPVCWFDGKENPTNVNFYLFAEKERWNNFRKRTVKSAIGAREHRLRTTPSIRLESSAANSAFLQRINL